MKAFLFSNAQIALLKEAMEFQHYSALEDLLLETERTLRDPEWSKEECAEYVAEMGAQVDAYEEILSLLAKA